MDLFEDEEPTIEIPEETMTEIVTGVKVARRARRDTAPFGSRAKIVVLTVDAGAR